MGGVSGVIWREVYGMAVHTGQGVLQGHAGSGGGGNASTSGRMWDMGGPSWRRGLIFSTVLFDYPFTELTF